ncbi:MAG: 4-(cytidine 5'-diphospho)-2-C-methyl-D-erythritol kinase [Gammaproteobacteria bacterium]|nr:4-(cytidine 5'-diphospho)-2-C-methyl-D-erythritol kinase [Gammaproteobacteria bacterium]NIM74471.1 4-(cytidine 5'-diphospho)-2-C-methyl-D-erythritol kinase [Gammaproteobacteria bacterium]NIO26304.1 4-(cytidine 5'-diphospho)-2-C-methyl-D-erythritol kinase [Gammaproteobacteria bacterium]NIO66856.1 4-(cytidine 5'-diphospho)-2-C-methyl-D-erythritol kinase [Gammaproteobacteria bacterium]NIP45167.1 4-(cytidine 5'-diphospho)-2-C-methyl-D-erythritol kinase [Gammaproteobacteria bacterium]
MNATPWPAPAKLNLFLHVLGRREDGYHELQTVFQFLDLHDSVSLAPRSDGRVRRISALEGVDEEADLVVRAARRLKAYAASDAGVDIAVEKRIPLGAGLGGGSSDAATTLRALDRLWDLGLGTERLAAIGLELGADVPVFVRGEAAFAEGVGERLEPLELETPWYLVVNPGCPVSTARVFADPALTRNSAPMRIRDFLPAAGGQVSVHALLRATRNDCEPVVRALYPEVDAALSWLARSAHARMTGTGACVFAPFREREEAQQRLAELPGGWHGFVARGMNRSSMLALV